MCKSEIIRAAVRRLCVVFTPSQEACVGVQAEGERLGRFLAPGISYRYVSYTGTRTDRYDTAAINT